MSRILVQIIAAVLGLWLAILVVPGVYVTVFSDSSFFGIPLNAQWQIFLLLGIILGLLNFFVKPLLNIITLPLRILTLGLFGFFVNMALVWIVDVMFEELSAPWFFPLFWTAIIIAIVNIFSQKTLAKEKD